MNGVHAYTADGHTGRWLESLRRLEAELKTAARIYPGHGESGGLELLKAQARYLDKFRSEVRDLLRASQLFPKTKPVIGYGNMAAALASRWAAKHDLFIGGRDRGKAQALATTLGHGARFGSEAEAAAFGEVVVLATRSESVFDAMLAAGAPDAFRGKLLLDINNPVVDAPRGDFLVKTFDGKSLAEAIAARTPAARVVKAFNMCQASVWKMDPPTFDGRRLVVLHCGDDAEAKRQVATLIEGIGCEPVDLGELKYARLLEPAAAMVIKFLLSGRDPHTVLNLIQPESKPIG